MRKIITLIITIISIVACMMPITEARDIKVTIDEIEINFDFQPRIIDGCTMVPARKISEELGATFQWDERTKSATIISGNKKIYFEINRYAIYVNNKCISLDTYVRREDGTVLVPVRGIAEALDVYVDWNNNERTVEIYTTDEHISKYKKIDNVDYNISQIENLINKGDYLRAIKECDQTIAWYNISNKDEEKLNDLKKKAQKAYDEYEQELIRPLSDNVSISWDVPYMKGENTQISMRFNNNTDSEIEFLFNDIKIYSKSHNIVDFSREHIHMYTRTSDYKISLIAQQPTSYLPANECCELVLCRPVSKYIEHNAKFDYAWYVNRLFHIDDSTIGYFYVNWKNDCYKIDFDMNGITKISFAK